MQATFATACIAGAAAALLLPCASRSETLAQAVESSIAWNPEVRAALSSWRAVAQTVTQARAQFLPSIDANLARGRERTDSPITRPLGPPPTLSRSEAGITVSQLLFDGGAASSELRRQEARAEAAYAQFGATAETVAGRTAQVFFEVLRLRALVALAEQNLAVHQNTLKQMVRRSDSGIGRRSDDRQTAARVALAQSTLAQLRGLLKQAEAGYRNQTGHAADALAGEAAPVASLPSTAQAAVDLALATHPAIRAAKLEVEASVADRNFAQSRYAPRATLELGATHNRDLDGLRGLNGDRTAMLVLRHNLFRGGADAARVREAEARRDQAGDLVARAQNDLERDVRQAWEGLESERVRLPDLQRYAEASAEVVEAYRSQFTLGQRSLLDVLNAENELYNARSGHVNGDIGVATGAYRVLAAMGRMLEQLGIRLPDAIQGESRMAPK